MKRLLVVDDDGAAMEGLRLLLTFDGYEVVGLTEPRRAIEALAGGGFDAVITDLEMPEIHGVSVVRAARAASAAAPVFVVSAYVDSPACAAAIEAGAARVFGKPLDYDTLADELAGRLRAPKGGP
jgi:DNA-binding NtrC family response regulator